MRRTCAIYIRWRNVKKTYAVSGERVRWMCSFKQSNENQNWYDSMEYYVFEKTNQRWIFEIYVLFLEPMLKVWFSFLLVFFRFHHHHRNHWYCSALRQIWYHKLCLDSILFKCKRNFIWNVRRPCWASGLSTVDVWLRMDTSYASTHSHI